MHISIGLLVLGLAPALASAQVYPELVSRSAAQQGDADSVRGRISADGRYVAFATASTGFDATDTNGSIDVYLKDRVSGGVTRISRTPAGAAPNGHSGAFGFAFDTHAIAISEDGRRVAFLSDATNIVADDGNLRRDAFVFDRTSNTTTLVSRTPAGAAANGDSTHVALSGDGGYVVFSSFATDLVGGDSNAMLDLFGRDPQVGPVERLNLVGIAGQMPTGASADRGAKEPSVSRDGLRIAFTCETNLGATDCAGQCSEIWLRDRSLQSTAQVSMGSGLPGTTAGSASSPVLSADGRIVAFSSNAVLAPPDTNANGSWVDVFLRDTALGQTEHVSRNSIDTVASHTGCDGAALSGDGRFVAFNCSGFFGPDDTMTSPEVYLRDRILRQTLRLAVGTLQQQGNFGSSQSVLSADGRFVAYAASSSNLVPGDSNGRVDVFLAANPFLTDPPSRLGGGGGDASSAASLSDDARYLFFETAEALLAGDTNGAVDVYRRELSSGALVRVSVGDDEGEIANGGGDYSVAADGESVAFVARDDGLVALKGEAAPRRVPKAPTTAVLLRNLVSGSTQRIGVPGIRTKQPALSKDGSRVAFVSDADALAPGDANGMDDVYIADVAAPATLTRVSAAPGGDANGPSVLPSLSADGSVVVFQTGASNVATGGAADTNGVADIVRANMVLAQRARISVAGGAQGNGPSMAPSVSADGRHVVFSSDASNLGGGADVNGARDILLVDAASGALRRISSAATGNAAGGASDAPTIASDGSTMAFASAAADLVDGDGNAQPDIYVVDRATLARRRLARGDGGTQPDGASLRPRLSRNGQHVAFDSFASNLTVGDVNGNIADAFVNGPLEPFLIFRGRFE